jgi:hypothetical protein
LWILTETSQQYRERDLDDLTRVQRHRLFAALTGAETQLAEDITSGVDAQS